MLSALARHFFGQQVLGQPAGNGACFLRENSHQQKNDQQDAKYSAYDPGRKLDISRHDRVSYQTHQSSQIEQNQRENGDAIK